MSAKSDHKSSEDKSDSICSEIQTLSSDQNNSSDENAQSLEYFEDIPGLTFASLLKTNCSYPTELFYTLSPISLSQMTCESTPITTNRRLPIGGENLPHQRHNRLNTFTIGSDDRIGQQVSRSAGTSQPVLDRPPLIGRTNSSESSRSTLLSQNSDESIGIQEISSVDRDALANKVRQLLGKTKPKSTDDDVESLGLIDDTVEDNCSHGTIDSQRSEPDGKGKPYMQNIQKIVYYSSSESEDNEEEGKVEEKKEKVESMTSLTSDASLKSSEKSDRRNRSSFDKSIRNRSYSTGHKRTVVDISSILRQRFQTKESFPTESCETQTSRSFLAEQTVDNPNTTRNKRQTDVSKAIQTNDSLLNIESKDKKELKEESCQTNNSFGISSFLKDLLKSQLKPRKVSAGTQTMRSYLTEQALKQQNIQMKRQTKEKSRLISQTIPLETKAIQTSYTSSVNSESDSTIINERTHSSVNSRRSRSLSSVKENKEPISWFIPIDKKSQNKNISRICKTGRNSGMKNKGNEQMSAISSPVPLQEAFNRHCIDMRINSQIRVNRINTIADLRKQTADERLIEMAKHFIRQQESAKVIRAKVIQPVFKSTIKRFFTHQEMRAQTEKVYHNLPEVKALRESKKQKEREKNQRLLAQLYKYRLKDNALKGRLTWKITQSCLN